MKNNVGFTLMELMIVIAIIGILVAIAIPSYQNYTRRAHYTEVVQAAAPYKTGVTECFQTLGDLGNCNAGSNGIPLAITSGQSGGLVDTADVAQGVITIVPKAIDGFKSSDNYILTPTDTNGQLNWKSSGGGVDAGYAK